MLIELSDEVRAQLIREMDAEELAAATEGMEVDDLADLIADLPEKVTQQLLRNMDQQDRERLSQVLSWPEDSAGGLMNTDTVSVRSDVSLEVVQRYLRMRGELPDRTDRLIVVDRNDQFLGTVTLASLLTEDPDKAIGASLDPEAPRIRAGHAGRAKSRSCSATATWCPPRWSRNPAGCWAASPSTTSST